MVTSHISSVIMALYPQATHALMFTEVHMHATNYKGIMS